MLIENNKNQNKNKKVKISKKVFKIKSKCNNNY